jgi:hypothetical protein
VAKLNPTQCRTTVYIYFLKEGWLPRGTTKQNWKDVTMSEMEFDDPPLPSDPNFQKRRIAMDLQFIFFNLGSQLGDSLEILADSDETLGKLAEWCHGHQE